jgi:hypothetical protein
MIGRHVEICSNAGIFYRGVVRSIRTDDELGELFELSSPRIAEYRRLVFVTDRLAQIRDIEESEAAS